MKPKIEWKKIKKGNRVALLNAIDDLVDYCQEDVFGNGYKSCLSDMSVRSYRLAEHIAKHIDKPYVPGDVKIDELARVIENYYKNAIKNEK